MSSSALSNNLHNDCWSFLTWAAPEADSWWLWYVVHDDVFIADTGGQALNIFPHSPESVQMMSFWSHTFIHILKFTL